MELFLPKTVVSAENQGTFSDYHYSSDRFDLSDYSTGYMSWQSVPVSGGLRPQGIFAQHGNHSHTYTGSRSYFLSRYLPAVECT